MLTATLSLTFIIDKDNNQMTTRLTVPKGLSEENARELLKNYLGKSKEEKAIEGLKYLLKELNNE